MISPIVHAELCIVFALRDAGASSAKGAQPFVARRVIEHEALRRLVAAGAVRDAGGQRYYLDMAAYRAHRGRVRKWTLIRVAVFVLFFVVLILSGVFPVSQR